jgi:hypothetical protein
VREQLIEDLRVSERKFQVDGTAWAKALH